MLEKLPHNSSNYCTNYISISNTWYQKKIHVDQSSKIEDPNMSTCNDSHLIFENNAKKICTGGRKASSPNDAGKSGCPHTEGKD